MDTPHLVVYCEHQPDLAHQLRLSTDVGMRVSHLPFHRPELMFGDLLPFAVIIRMFIYTDKEFQSSVPQVVLLQVILTFQ